MPPPFRRSPHGERGLKLREADAPEDGDRSLPARGAWVEITITPVRSHTAACRSPHGERGLKSSLFDDPNLDVQSLPARGAWVEIGYSTNNMLGNTVAPRTGSVG